MAIEVRETSDPLLLNPPRPDTVLTFDPGVAFMGIAVLNITSHEGKVTDIHIEHREQFKTPSSMPIEQRLDAACKRIHWAFATFHPDVVGWENVVAVSAGKDSKGGASSNGGRIKEVSGMIRMACRFYAERPSYILMPATYRKMAFGKGNSRGKTKKDMKRIIEKFLNVRNLTEDESEALAMGLCTYSQWKGAACTA